MCTCACVSISARSRRQGSFFRWFPNGVPSICVKAFSFFWKSALKRESERCERASEWESKQASERVGVWVCVCCVDGLPSRVMRACMFILCGASVYVYVMCMACLLE